MKQTVFDQADDRLYAVGDSRVITDLSPFGGTSNASDSWNYVDQIIRDQLTDRNNPEHLAAVQKWHPWAHKTTEGVSEKMWLFPPDIVDSDGEKMTDGPEYEATRLLESRHWRDSMYQGTTYERTQGWSVAVLRRSEDTDIRSLEKGFGWKNKEDAFMYRVPNCGPDLRTVEMFDPVTLDMSEAKLFGPDGWPVAYRYHFKTGEKEEQVDIAADRCILIRPRPSMTWKGTSVLASGWSFLLWFLATKESLSWFMSKYGISSIVIPQNAPITDAERTTISNSLRDLNKRKVMFMDPNATQAPSFLTPPVFDFSKEHDNSAGAFAASVDLPQMWLTGSAAGALASSTEDRKQVQSKVRQNHLTYESTVQRFIEAVMPETEADWGKVKVVFPIKFTHDEVESANILNTKIQTAVAGVNAQLITINEGRKFIDLPVQPWGEQDPMEKAEADAKRQAELMPKINVNSPGKPKDKPVSRGDQALLPPRTTKARLLYEFGEPWNVIFPKVYHEQGDSVRGTIRALGIGTNTFYSLKEEYEKDGTTL